MRCLWARAPAPAKAVSLAWAALFLLVLWSAANHSQRMQLSYLGLGVVFGGLVLVIAACLAMAAFTRVRPRLSGQA